MDELTAFFTSMLALSVGVERIVEIVKGMVPFLRDDPSRSIDSGGHRAAWRRICLQVLAVGSGAGIAAIVGPELFIRRLPTTGLGMIGGCVLVGLLGSGGSALWNHALDIVAAVKGVRESVAKQVETAQQRGGNLPVGP
jgi:hypothetical protein